MDRVISGSKDDVHTAVRSFCDSRVDRDTFSTLLSGICRKPQACVLASDETIPACYHFHEQLRFRKNYCESETQVTHVMISRRERAFLYVVNETIVITTSLE